MNIKKQRGSITLLGALGIFTAIGGMYSVLELGDKMIKKAQFNAHAEAIAPIAMRSEMALTQAMVENGEVDKPYELSQAFLQQLGLTSSDVTIKLTFGNITHLEQPEKVTTGQGQEILTHEKFIPLETHADNPKKGLGEGDMPPKFNAVAVQITATRSGIFKDFRPQGRAIYGLIDSQEDTPEMGSCFCDARYSACLSAEKTDSVMGEPESSEREQYCEVGYSPSMMGGGLVPKFGNVNSVQFSPQWVGRPYQGEKGGTSTDETSSAWQTVDKNAPLAVSAHGSIKLSWTGPVLAVKADNPFPEAGWSASDGDWLSGKHQVIDYKTSMFSPKIMKEFLNTLGGQEDKFYVGRSLTCTYYSGSSFVMNLFQNVTEFNENFKGKTRCLRYSAPVKEKYKFAKILSPLYDFGHYVTGANQHFYSCRDFSGLQSSRSGYIQVLRRIWTNPIEDWTKSYQQSDCSVKQMHFHGFWIFGHWE